jgi:Predicted membrane protein
LILAHYVSAEIGLWGATVTFLNPFVTLTFVIFTPETWVSGQDSHPGFLFVYGAGRVVLKDTIMMASGLTGMVHSAKCILAQNQHERDYTAKVSGGII